MRLILVSSTCYSQTSEKNNFVRCLAARLQTKCYEVFVVAPSESLTFTKSKINGVTILGIPAFPFYYEVKTLVPIPVMMDLQVKRIIKNLKPDMIHIHDHHSLSQAFVAVNKKFGIPIMGTNHLPLPKNYLFGKNQKASQLISRLSWRTFIKIFNQLSVVTAFTERSATIMRSKITTKVITIPNGIDLTENNLFKDNECTRKAFNLPYRPTLLYIDNGELGNNLEDVLNGVAQALKTTDFSFIVIGNDVIKQTTKAMIEEKKLTANVYLFSDVPNHHFFGFYRLADCYITASTAAQERTSIMKAMAHGLPIIAPNADLLNDLVHDGINGYMFGTGDVDAISNYIHIIFTVKYIHRNMSRKSLAYIQYHDLDKTIYLFEELYHKNHWLHNVLQNI